MHTSRSSKIAIIMGIVSAALLLAPAATSVPTGVENAFQSGCNCHGATPSDSVTASIDGLPDSYNYSEEYNLTLSFVGGPTNLNNINQGGFNLWVSHGKISVDDGTAQIWSDNEASHTEAGNDQTSWLVKWTAPADDRSVEFILHVNSVNGNADGASGGGRSGGGPLAHGLRHGADPGRGGGEPRSGRGEQRR